MEKERAGQMTRAEYEAYLKNKGKKRKRRRGNGRSFIAPVLLVLVLLTCLTLCFVFFFRVDSVEVRETDLADKHDIISASGIEAGDNLLILDAEAAARGIYGLNPEIDHCIIEKKYPSTVEISLVRGEGVLLLEGEDCYYLVSERNRIMSVGSLPEENLPIIRGIEKQQLKVGSFLPEEEGSAYHLALLTIQALQQAEMPDFGLIDVSDIYNVNVLYDGRVRLVLGNEANLQTKVNSIAKTFYADFQKEDYGVIDGSIELYKTSVRKGEEHIRYFDRTEETSENSSEQASDETSGGDEDASLSEEETSDETEQSQPVSDEEGNEE